MLKEKLIGAFLFAYTLFCNCYTEPARSPFERAGKAYRVEAYARLPAGLKESSGLARGPAGTFWVLQDGGNSPYLYRVAASGQLLDTLKLNLPNKDWESLAEDEGGNLYIGDFGNNLNQRKDLRIFKLNRESGQVDTISFYYPEQQSFPPESRKDWNYDAEAFVWQGGRLHLFTKSYGDKIVRHYSLPDSAGSYAARREGERRLHGLVTAAALSPDGQELALLSYGRLYLFDVTKPSDFLKNPRLCINLAGRAQTEALVYINENDLLLTNEQRRLLYVYEREK